MHRSPGLKIRDYESAMKRIAPFNTVEDFWRIYVHLRPIGDIYMDYHLFRDGIAPTYEDPANINGGKWSLRLKKGLACPFWENIILALVGDGFNEVGDDICGAVMSVRNGEDVLSVWNKTASNGTINLKIRNIIRKCLGLKADVVMEYKAHAEKITTRQSNEQ